VRAIDPTRFPFPRPELLTPIPEHGSPDYAELERLGLSPDEIADFSVNVNPYGPSLLVWEAIRRTPVDRYPDREALALRRALAGRLACAPEQVVVGNGVTELLWAIALAFVRRGDRAFIVGPAFGEYRRAVSLMGGQVIEWVARPEDEFAVPQALADTLRQVQPHLAFICNPNNPTGVLLPCEMLCEWARAIPQTLFVVDEAYITFAREARSVATLTENILVLRSMTKDYALAGLRLGYAVGSRVVIEALGRAIAPWNVNALAQAAGLAALADEEHVRRALARLAQDKEALVQGLRDLGWNPLPSAAQFFLVEVGDGAAWRRELLRRKILVRDCASFGLPAYVRLSTRQSEENARLLAALREMLSC
jgi:histidinol-phosphate aminotransferase